KAAPRSTISIDNSIVLQWPGPISAPNPEPNLKRPAMSKNQPMSAPMGSSARLGMIAADKPSSIRPPPCKRNSCQRSSGAAMCTVRLRGWRRVRSDIDQFPRVQSRIFRNLVRGCAGTHARHVPSDAGQVSCRKIDLARELWCSHTTTGNCIGVNAPPLPASRRAIPAAAEDSKGSQDPPEVAHPLHWLTLSGAAQIISHGSADERRPSSKGLARLEYHQNGAIQRPKETPIMIDHFLTRIVGAQNFLSKLWAVAR